VTDAALLRPSDLAYSGGDPSRAAERLGWRATVRGTEAVRRMVQAEQVLANEPIA
jgi:GDPmannose 4,6-dehydratase